MKTKVIFLPKVLTPEQKYMQTATGAMAKPPNPEDLKFKTAVDGYVHLHPGSVTAKVVRSVLNITVSRPLLSSASRFETPYLVFHEKVKTSRVFVREVCLIVRISSAICP